MATTDMTPTPPQDGERAEALVEDIAQARRTAAYWKAEHIAGNVEIERLKRQSDEVVGALHAEAIGFRLRAEAAEAALAPFAKLAKDREERYRKRGGNLDIYPDSHPSFDICADHKELPLGVWRAAIAALDSEESR